MERLLSILAGVALVMILISGAGVYITSSSVVSQARNDAAVANARTVALTISKRVQLLGDLLNQMAQEPDVINAVSSGDKSVMAAAAARLERYMPGVKKIRLIPVGTVEADQSSSPKMGFGDVDMVKATFQETPMPAVQGDAGPDRHLAMTRKIMKGNELTGVILASLDYSFINQVLGEGFEKDDYAELKQAKLSLAENGKTDDADDDLNKLAIPGTSWEIYFTNPNNSSIGYGLIVFSLILVPLMLALAAFYLTYQRLMLMLEQDQDCLLKAFKDILTNQPRGSYPVVLNGMNAVVAAMVRFNREVEKKGAETMTQANDEDFELESDFDDLEESAQDISHQIEEVDTRIKQPPAMNQKPPAGKMQTYIDVEPEEITPVSIAETAQTPSKLKSESDTIFRAYDIRGVVGKSLTENIVRDIGRALGSEAKESGCHLVVVGRDGRLSSQALADALAEGITSTGCNVINIGLVPTPVLYFVVQHSDGRTGVMITGSHNPADYNGLKMMIKGDTLAGERIQKLRQRIESQSYIHASQPGSIEENAMFVNEYIGTLCEDIQVNIPLKVVVDCGNGAAGEIAPRMLAELGCKVIPMYCEIDGNFPHHHPDPSKPENLAELIAAVRQNDADLGIAFDGDGDRLGVVDSKGKIIWPDRQMMLFAKDVLAGKPGSEIIFDVKCSRHLADQIIKYGGRPLMWKTGHSFMKAKLKETGAKLAGEMSGHIFFNDRWFGFDDALYSAARLMQILSEDGRDSADIFDDFPDSVNTPELNVLLAEGENVQFVEDMFAKANFKEGKITNIDGMRIDFPDGWGLVRASNTTPSLVIRFEADTKEALNRIQNEFRELMLKVKPGIKLPF